MKRSMHLVRISGAICGLLSCGAPERPPTSAPSSAIDAGVFSNAASASSSGLPPGHSDFIRTLAETAGFRRGSPEKATPTKDGAVVFLQSPPREAKQALYQMDVKTGAVKELAAADKLLAEPETLTVEEKARRERMRVSGRGITDFELDPTTKHVLFTLSGKLFVLDRATGEARTLKTATAVLDPHWSPDGKRIGYVRENDVYVIDVVTGRETAVTKGGTDVKPRGVAEFVAQEELGRSRGYWFSPNAESMLYADVDTTRVERMKISDPAHPEREPVRFAYPRAGKPNATVRLAIANLKQPGAKLTNIDWDNVRFPYLATVTWEKNAPLTLYVLDRRQTTSRLLAVDERTGKTTTLVEETDAAFINVDRTVPQWFDDGTAFLWSSERSGSSRLEVRKRDGSLSLDLTPAAVRAVPGPLGYRSVIAFDRLTHDVWYEAGADAAHASVVRVDGNKGALTATLVASEPEGSFRMRSRHGARDVFVTSRTTNGSMPAYAVWREGSPATTSVPLPSRVETPAFMPNVEITTVGEADYRIAIVRPRVFDQSRKYPVIDAAYGGPHSAVVGTSADRYLRAQWIADETNAIVVAIDAQGTPFRGRSWERAIFGQFGSVPLDGHVAAIAALGKKYPAMDTTRVGVYGWSFGGYFSALAVLRAPEVYKVGVAGAPVVDWLDYDSCYTERYLGVPDGEPASWSPEVKAAYESSNILTYAKNKVGTRRPLLIVHGTADDNVYFVHSLKLAEALTRAERPFEFLPLVGVTHMLSEPELAERAWRKMAGYLKAHL